MKNTLLLFSVFLAFCANGQTSIYHPFPDSNAVWNIKAYCPMGAGQVTYSIVMGGDTLINSQRYHKLTIPFVQSISTASLTCGITAGYKGAVQQDVANRKVYFVPPANNSEQLLYDFNMQVGDTVKGYIEANTNPKDTVRAIDSVLVGSSYRKRWKINSCYNIYFIEGIGSTSGLIGRSPACILDQGTYEMTCFRQNNQTLYPATATNCQLITSVNPADENQSQVKIFPNPSPGFFTIEFDNVNNKEIRLTDLPGRIVLQQRVGNKTRININDLPGGTYILTIMDKYDRITSRRIISCL